MAGTTTKTSVYTDIGGLTAFPNPIILNARGEPTPTGNGPSTGIWLVAGQSYKFVLSPATDTDPPTNPIWTVDQISAAGGGSGGAQYVADTGTVNALAVALTPAPSSYTAGLQFLVKAANTSTGACTVNVNGLGAKSITIQGSPVQAGGIQAGQLYWLVYDGTYFALVSLPGQGNWVVNSDLAQMAAGTVKGNNTGSTATPQDIPLSSIQGNWAPGQAGEFFYSGTLPNGWLLCNGQAVSRTSYAALFAAIGTTFGAGDGSTTFNLPDARGLFLRGSGTNGTLATAVSAALGTIQADQTQGHVHYDGVVSTTGSPPAYAYATTTSDIPGSSGNTMHTDNNVAQQQGLTSSPKSDGSNGTPRLGAETRAANLAVVIAIHI